MAETQRGAFFPALATPPDHTEVNTSSSSNRCGLVSTVRMVYFPFSTLLEKYGLHNIDISMFTFAKLFSITFEWNDVVDLFLAFFLINFQKHYKRCDNSTKYITLQCQGCNGLCTSKLYFRPANKKLSTDLPGKKFCYFLEYEVNKSQAG